MVPVTREVRLVRWRHYWRQVHLWIGLLAGFFLALVGLSGSLLVFNETMMRAEAPALFQDLPEEKWLPVSVWISKAEARFPKYAPIESVHGIGAVPVATGVPTLFKHVERDGAERHVLIGVNPVTGEPTGAVEAEDTWIGTFLLFHIELLAGEAGSLIIGIVAVGGLLLTATGLYLWWPRPGRWRTAFRMRRGAFGQALLLDIHNVPTIWLFVPYLLVLVTGLYLQKPNWIDPIVTPFSEVRSLPDGESASEPPGICAKPTDLDDAIRLARAGREPSETIRSVFLPSGARSPFVVDLSAPGANPRLSGTQIWVDRNCPKLIAVREPAGLTTGEAVKRWLWPLHANLGLGLIGQTFVFATGLLLPLLFGTGVLMWWRRR